MKRDHPGEQKVRFCSTCLAMSTRPRITFDIDGRCNACRWAETKKELDWGSRKGELDRLLDQHRGVMSSAGFDCLVPVSGGKDGSYVAHRLKRDFGMTPLCVTVTPALPLDVGQRNLQNFIASGFDHVSISPDPEAMRAVNRYGLKNMGFPYYGWLVAIHTAVLTMSARMGIALIFYGEDGEVEYGGDSGTQSRPLYDATYIKSVYLERGYEAMMNSDDVRDQGLSWFRFPDQPLSSSQLRIAHWSYFEDWDPYRNYLVAKEHCGLEEVPHVNSGTFTNFAQNDQALYPLHTYLMYLKFGFGRANQDACIEIRRGAMSRTQALNLVRIYDGTFPEEYLDLYLEYYRMDAEEFFETLGRWANPELFERQGRRWIAKFEIV